MPPTPQPSVRSSAVDDDRRADPARRVPALPCAVLCTVVFGLLLTLVAMGWGPLMSVDRALAGVLHRTAVAAPGWTRLNRVLSDWLWDPWMMRAVLVGAVVLLVRRGERLLGVWVAVTALVGTGLQQVLKAVVGRDRPVWADPVDTAHYAAFPSGHAMSALVAGALVLWVLRLGGARPLWRWTARAVAVVSVAGVGFTRVYLGVHWLSDVVGGWLLGGALVAAAAAAYTGYAPRPEVSGAARWARWRS
ncbi:phosphatase PAP2 family protein [Streptomyces sp. WAC01526]|uniref:phosphatase PAP2 family protein n=1 Tax=Streptomyces sp. WAC01526 TaxID=2588709 RepID=UPI0011DFBAA0|nr:phosphatase PAP2 family protein [Streptomyces sp. WAC01526]